MINFIIKWICKIFRILRFHALQYRLRKPISSCCFIIASVPGRVNCFEFRTRLDQAKSRVANWIVGIQANTTLSDYCVGRCALQILQVSAFKRSRESLRRDSKSLARDQSFFLLSNFRSRRLARRAMRISRVIGSS